MGMTLSLLYINNHPWLQVLENFHRKLCAYELSQEIRQLELRFLNSLIDHAPIFSSFALQV
jgi:hypothetical protein